VSRGVRDRTGADFELREAARPQDAGQVQGQDHPVHCTGSADWSERHLQLFEPALA
jgi:hypothetical protein